MVVLCHATVRSLVAEGRKKEVEEVLKNGNNGFYKAKVSINLNGNALSTDNAPLAIR